jgi:type VI secretion system protein ImpM
MTLKQTGAEPDLLAALAGRSMPAHLRAPSVWSAQIEGDQRLLVCEGLPEGPNMQALFDFDAPVWAEEAT